MTLERPYSGQVTFDLQIIDEGRSDLRQLGHPGGAVFTSAPWRPTKALDASLRELRDIQIWLVLLGTYRWEWDPHHHTGELPPPSPRLQEVSSLYLGRSASNT